MTTVERIQNGNEHQNSTHLKRKRAPKKIR